MEKQAALSQPMKKSHDSVITFMLFWCALIVVSSAYVTTPLLPVFEETFHITTTMSAWTSSSFSLFYAIGFLLFGPLADRMGTKQVILLGFLSLTVITPLIGLTTSFPLLLVLRGLQGFFASTFAPSALAYAFDIFPSKKIVTAIGFISFGYVTSGIIGQVLADLVNQWWDWKMVFITFGCLYGVTFLAILLWMPRPITAKSKEGIKFYLHHTILIFKQRNFQLIYGITMMILLTFMGMYTLLGSFLSHDPFHMTGKEILAIRAIGIIGMLVSPFVGRIVKKIGTLQTLRTGLMVAAGGLFLIGVGNNIGFLVVMSIVYVFGVSLVFPALMVLIGELGGERRTLANAYYAFILFIGAMLGPIIAVELLRVVSYFTIFLLFAILLVFGFLLTLKIKR